MKYTAQRHRLDALEAALGGRGTRIVITGGLPVGTTMPQPSEPPEPAPEGRNIGVHPNVDLGSKTK
jgi:hypothetical protein